MRVALVLFALLLGGRPAAPAPDALILPDGAPWFPLAGSGHRPVVTSPCPGLDSGWRFAFPASRGQVGGYAEVPLDGERLRESGFSSLEAEYRTGPGRETPFFVLGTADGGYRVPIPDTGGEWKTISIPLRDFPADRGNQPLEDRAVRLLRIETPPNGFSSATWIDVRHLAFRCDPGQVPEAAAAPEASLARGGRRAGAPTFEGRVLGDEPAFLCGVFLLGANRTLLGDLGEAGANCVVEYGPNVWPNAVVEDHLDAAHGAGVGLFGAVTHETGGPVETADDRLRPLGDHPALLGWYLFDEPDGALPRGIPRDDASPQTLRRRRDALAPVPSLVTFLNAFGLSRYRDTADLFATDYYLPAYAPGQSLARIHSDAASVVEISEGAGAVPLLVLQLDDYAWREPAKVVTPASMRAQAYAAIAAGVRGLLFFQGSAAVRAADEGSVASDLWPAFLELSGDLATLGPLAGRWVRVPGELRLGASHGEVRAGCFRDGDERWIVIVNTGRRPESVTITGECLRDARRIEDPRTGWSAGVSRGEWSGRLEGLEARVVRVVLPDESSARVPALVQRFPAVIGDGPFRFGDVLLGGTLDPAPDGPVQLTLDGADRTREAQVHRGAAAAVRWRARDLSPGTHRATVRWRHDGTWNEESWDFDVDPLTLPIADGFERSALGGAWGRCDGTTWNYRDPDERPARGTIDVRGGELHVRSTGGGLGVVLRRFEAPPSFEAGFAVRLPRAGDVLILRGGVFQALSLPAGTSRVRVIERPGLRRFLVNGTDAARWTPSLNHARGALGFGVRAGGEAFFDDFRVEAR